MSATVQLKALGFQKAVLIDDAFAPPEVRDMDGRSITLMNEALRDDGSRIRQLEEAFGVTLDPQFPEQTIKFLEDFPRLASLWEKRSEPAWRWLRDSVFRLYEEEVDPKFQALRPILDYFAQTEVTLHRYANFDSAIDEVSDSDIVFLDFFLKDEIQAERSLARADQLSHLIYKLLIDRQRKTPFRYPLFVLFSSRPEAERLAAAFKERSTLRGCFFQFLPKSHSDSSGLELCLDRLLPDYVRNQSLARLLDGYWLAAFRAADSVKHHVQRLEPADVGLLHAAALIAENEHFGHYLTWLISTYFATVFAADDELKARSQEVLETGSKVPLPGHIPPNAALSELFVAASLRDDIGDQSQYSLQYDVGLGDIFVEGGVDQSLPNPEQLLVVIDQSCDLKHAASKTRVLCLRASKVVEIRDIALAIYHPEKWPTYFLRLSVGGKRGLYRVTWNLVDAQTVEKKSLDQRLGFARIARLQDVIALQLQERYLNNVGRIGLAVQPPLVGGYKAKLRVGKTSMDACNQAWAAVTVVQGRAPKISEREPKPGNTDAAGAPAVPAQNKAVPPESAASLELFFCGEFVDWLNKSLPSGEGTARDVELFRKALGQEGGPRGKLGAADPNGVRKLIIGVPTSPTRIDVVESDALFDSSAQAYVMQIITDDAGAGKRP
jgi:hypothetical protein